MDALAHWANSGVVLIPQCAVETDLPPEVSFLINQHV